MQITLETLKSGSPGFILTTGFILKLGDSVITSG